VARSFTLAFLLAVTICVLLSTTIALANGWPELPLP